MRRHAKELLESSTEMEGAQANKSRQRGGPNVFGEMFLDIRSDHPLLPTGETSSRLRLDLGLGEANA
jgi:hypothetical protein